MKMKKLTMLWMLMILLSPLALTLLATPAHADEADSAFGWAAKKDPKPPRPKPGPKDGGDDEG